jgi:ABC-type amino acid transport system permease subunit
MPDTSMSLITGFLYAFRLNIEVGLYALLGGVLFGFPLTLMRVRVGWTRVLAEGLTSLLRAFPVFVLMFVLLGVLSDSSHLIHQYVDNIPKITLILALSAYATAVVSDAAQDCWQYVQQSDTAKAILLIPNLFRIFTILVMASSIGAAIGVNDAVSYTLSISEATPNALNRIWLVFLATLFFVAFFSIIRLSLYLVVQRLSNRFH